MSSKRYLEEIKIDSVNHVANRGHTATHVINRTGITRHSLHQWIKHTACRKPSGPVDSSDLVNLKSEK